MSAIRPRLIRTPMCCTAQFHRGEATTGGNSTEIGKALEGEAAAGAAAEAELIVLETQQAAQHMCPSPQQLLLSAKET